MILEGMLEKLMHGDEEDPSKWDGDYELRWWWQLDSDGTEPDVNK